MHQLIPAVSMPALPGTDVFILEVDRLKFYNQPGPTICLFPGPPLSILHPRGFIWFRMYMMFSIEYNHYRLCSFILFGAPSRLVS